MYIMSRNVYILFEIVVCFLLLLLLYFLLLNIGKKLDRKNPGYVNRRGDSVGSFSRLFLSITLIERMRSIYPFVELTYACISVQQQSSTKHEECEREREKERKEEGEHRCCLWNTPKQERDDDVAVYVRAPLHTLTICYF